MGLCLLKLTHQVVDFCGWGDVKRRSNEWGEISAAMIAGGKQIFLVNDAHNIVYAFMVDRQTGKTLFGKNGGGLVHGSGVFKGDYIHPGGENVLCVQVVKADSRADKLALFPVQTSLALGLRHKGEKLFIRDAVVLLFMEQPVQQLFPLGKEKISQV